MKTLVIYDSVNGNTEKIARAIAGAIPGATIQSADSVKPEILARQDLLVVGAPTYGGKPSPVMVTLLDKIISGSLTGVKVAAFDTRMPARWVKIFGFAASKIADTLKNNGGKPVGAAEGYFVKTAKGPLLEGEIERAAAWAKGISIAAAG